MMDSTTSEGSGASGAVGADDLLITRIQRYLALDETISHARDSGAEEMVPERLEAICRALDDLDLDALWSTRPHTRAGALALLMLLHRIGWQCCHPAEDAAPQRQAIVGIMAVIEALPDPEPR